MRKLAVTTPCTRPANLHVIHRSIFSADGACHFEIEWNVVFDADVLCDLPLRVVEAFAEDPRVFLSFNRCDPEVACRRNAHINALLQAKLGEDFWHYVVEDDNLVHPGWLARLHDEMEKHPLAQGFICSQEADARGAEVIRAAPDAIAASRINPAQYVLNALLIGERAYPTDRPDDGRFLIDLYGAQPQRFVFIDEVLSYRNALRRAPSAPRPRILVVSRSSTPPHGAGESEQDPDRLDVRVVEPHADLRQAVAELDPDAIVSFGATPETTPGLFALPFDLQRRWLDAASDTDWAMIADRADERAMQVMLGRSAAEAPPLVSIFTLLHDTGARLWGAYRSLASQGHSNWEWVLVDDSRWGATTLATARQIARRDPRVHIYDLYPKSGGKVGEAKYRGAVLCRGDYLLELDDRDELTPWALELLVEAFRQFPEAGFAYSDWACVDDALPPVSDGPSVAFGYGSYYQEVHRGIPLRVARPPAPNPKTVRHAAAMPQGFRAWRRDVYYAIGGHNRRLAMLVDYELMLRTFLATHMVHVPKLCYLHHRSGDVDERPAADIAGSGRSISRFYDVRIRSRFAQLGLSDWAAQASPTDPQAAPSRFGAAEQSAVLTMTLPRSAPFGPP